MCSILGPRLLWVSGRHLRVTAAFRNSFIVSWRSEEEARFMYTKVVFSLFSCYFYFKKNSFDRNFRGRGRENRREKTNMGNFSLLVLTLAGSPLYRSLKPFCRGLPPCCPLQSGIHFLLPVKKKSLKSPNCDTDFAPFEAA